jgi:thiamine-phosphate pyrophosphorylase
LFLYYITDRRQLSTDHDESIHLLLDRISAAAKAGVDAIQLREKELSARELVTLGLRAAGLVHRSSRSGSGARTRLLINSCVDVAIACGADGVHLRSDDFSAADARVVFGHAGIPSPLIGVSCHELGEVELAEGNGANFAVYGPVFGKPRPEATATGLINLEAVCRRRKLPEHPMPVVALGGVTVDNAAECLKRGAGGVAGIRLFQNGNVTETVSYLRNLAEDLRG